MSVHPMETSCTLRGALNRSAGAEVMGVPSRSVHACGRCDGLVVKDGVAVFPAVGSDGMVINKLPHRVCAGGKRARSEERRVGREGRWGGGRERWRAAGRGGGRVTV